MVRLVFSPIPKSGRAICRVGIGCGPPPEFSSGQPASGIVHHLSGPGSWPGAGARRCPRTRRWSVAPPSSVRERRRIRGGIIRPGLGSPRDQRRSAESAADRLSPIRALTERIARPHRFPPDNFKHSLTLFSKSFSSFPRALGRNLPPYLGCIPKQPDFADSTSRWCDGVGTPGAVTLSGAPFHGTCARGCSHLTWGAIRARPRSAEASCPAGVLLSGASDDLSPWGGGGGTTTRRAGCPWGKVFSATLAEGARATNLLSPRRPAPPPAVGGGAEGGGGGCVRRGLEQRYRRARTHASPLIEHFTDHSIGRAAGAELTGQIAPPTKSGHAPPPIESEKSSRSVNPYYMRTWGAATRPVKARGASPVEGTSRPVHPAMAGPIDQPKVSRLGNFLPAAFLGCGSVSRAPSLGRTLILRHPSIPW
ncbi:hypothetical protein H6P81_021462 [Aristolochia fimbriata]|uniref:Uncharacterized protein n=1 Tax=Aristolochia fimbriata TaxID=158543 RepID=A0AAV7DPT7_ARIFI|nr:hypothetical protein H6P81_021462 [Aristolochia fimbriata]